MFNMYKDREAKVLVFSFTNDPPALSSVFSSFGPLGPSSTFQALPRCYIPALFPSEIIFIFYSSSFLMVYLVYLIVLLLASLLRLVLDRDVEFPSCATESTCLHLLMVQISFSKLCFRG